jgi:hypothetical protein
MLAAYTILLQNHNKRSLESHMQITGWFSVLEFANRAQKIDFSVSAVSTLKY